MRPVNVCCGIIVFIYAIPLHVIFSYQHLCIIQWHGMLLRFDPIVWIICNIDNLYTYYNIINMTNTKSDITTSPHILINQQIVMAIIQ